MINLITGELTTHETDFSFNGPIPLVWRRNYFSHIQRNTLLGKTWHCNYEQTIRIDRLEDSFFFQNNNGNELELPYLETGDEAYIVAEKIKYRHEQGKITIEEYEKDLIYEFEYQGGNLETYRLSKIRKNRFKIEFIYTAGGRLDHIIDSSNREIHIRRDNEQRITRVEHDGKTLVVYEYNEEGYLTAAFDTLEQAETYTYDLNHNLSSKTDRNKNTQYWQYENKKEEARCVARWTTSREFIETFTFEEGKTIGTDARGNKTSHFHKNGQIVQVTDPLGNSEAWEYNLKGEVMRYTDKLGLHTYYGYDDYGHQTSVRLPNGGTTSYIFENNRMTMAKNANNAVWVWLYDEKGFLTTRIGHDKDITRFEYTNDLLTKVIDANGLETHLEYNEQFNLEKVILPNGETTQWEYNGQGQLINALSSRETAVNYRYDELGRVVQMKTVDGNQIYLDYDANGNVIKAKDKHHSVTFEYSPTGKLKSRQENDTKISFAYNKTDQLQAITNEHKSLYQFQRDKCGNITQESGFDGLTRNYIRNAGGQVSQTKTPDGKHTDYSYDKLGNVSIINYYDNTQEVYTYDKLGHLVEAVNENGFVKLERDELGRVLKETQNQVELTSAYDPLGQRIKLTSNLGANIDITRNKQGEITTTTAIQADSKWEVNFTRDHQGLEIERHLPGNVSSNWKRDKSGKPTHHSINQNEQTQTKKHYHWDVNDRLEGIYDQLKGEMTRFEHDLFGNLAAAGYADGSWDYKLPDEIGNLFKTKDKTDRQYGKAGQLLKDENYTYTYDKLGNLTQKESLTEKWQYYWYQNGHLKKVIRPDRKEVTFTYDALGRRLTKTFEQETTHFIWDGNVPLHEWSSLQEQATTVVTEKGEQEIPIPDNLITWVFEDGTFVPMAKLQNGKSYSIITDHLGTPFEAYDKQGKKVWERQLGIYGQIRKESGEINFIPYLYQGQYLDVETGLVYNRFRYYSPESGTYVSQDPLKIAGNNPNIYAYAFDSNSEIDPLGLDLIFPNNPDDMTAMLGVEPQIGTTPDGTPRYKWQPNSNTRIRYESHPHGLSSGDAGFNPRHHGPHYHVETKPDGLSWSQAKRRGLVTKSLPDGYTPGSGTGFKPGESFPGCS